MEYIITVIAGYLIGCSSMSYYIAKLKGINIKESGSRNYGASNTMALAGWKAGALVAVHDVGKAIIAVVLTDYLYSDNSYLPLIAGVACIIGHIFPFYLKFDGGKGFASFIGMTLAINWKLGLIIIVLVIVATLLTDYIVSGTFFSIVAVPVAIGVISHDVIQAVIICIATAVIFYKHKQNIINLLNGKEMRFSKANKKEYRYHSQAAVNSNRASSTALDKTRDLE